MIEEDDKRLFIIRHELYEHEKNLVWIAKKRDELYAERTLIMKRDALRKYEEKWNER